VKGFVVGEEATAGEITGGELPVLHVLVGLGGRYPVGFLA